jgi:hypothetical protein
LGQFLSETVVVAISRENTTETSQVWAYFSFYSAKTRINNASLVWQSRSVGWYQATSRVDRRRGTTVTAAACHYLDILHAAVSRIFVEYRDGSSGGSGTDEWR